MRKLILLLLAAVPVSVLWAQVTPGWLRYAAISPDGQTIVFTYKGDLYRVPATGGAATSLTQHAAHDYMPVWSHDGKSIAFASDRFGNFDVFVMPAGGGEPRRVTYHSASEYPYEFSADNKTVLFGAARQDASANREFPSASQPELYQVAITGGRVQQLLTTPAEEVRLSKNQRYLLYQDKKGGENTWRKHHTSSITRDIWVYDKESGTHRKITTFNGEDRTPVFTDNDKAFYYLSEESGSFNVHKMSLEGGASQQVTAFKKHPVRFLTVSDNGLLCFSYDGELYTQQANGKPAKVNITIAADVKSNNEQVMQVNGGVRDMAVSPNGKEVAYIYRGEVFVSSVEGGVTRRITNTPEQERSVVFSPDGKALLYASERGNSWKIYETKRQRSEEPYFYAATLLKESLLFASEHETYQPLYSPDGKEVAFIEDRMNLKVYNIASGKIRTLLTDQELFSMGDVDQYFEWSPDGKWLLFDYSLPGVARGEIGLIQADGKGKVVNLTENGFSDMSGKWIMGGKAMLWFSNRDGLKSVAQSGSSQMDVYGLFFTQEAFDNFKLSKEEATLQKEIEENKAKADSSKKKETKKDSVKIDWQDLVYRKARFTIHSSSLSDALVSKDGENLYYLARFEKGTNLWTTNLRTKETKMLVALNSSGGSMEWDKDQKNIFLAAGGSISKIEVSSGKRESLSIAGEMTLDIAAERRFMFEHVWRRTKETFYTASMHGVNWDSYKPDYEKYLPFIGDGYEFAELLSELLGELNVSHSGAAYYGSGGSGDVTASLGAFYSYAHQGNGVLIEEVLKGGPLDKAVFTVKPGMIIESIDGEVITPDKDLAQYLNRKAGKNVLLVIADGAVKKEVTVKPVTPGEESELLYKRWVRRNQEEVDRLSNGSLGYVHIPGMNDGAYRATFEEMMGKYINRKGIVIDTRFNGGGDLVADLAMFLGGKKFMDYSTDTRSNGYEPNFRWTKPSISLACESNYSDGHCYAFTYQELKLGKLVGMPVPGTCTFAGWEMLQEPGLRWGVPPLGCKDMKGQYLENHQTEPDIKVMNEYQVAGKGKDQQLEAAVTELLKEVK
ncbi:C-terminal processing protease CtpA/Prc, contains a PDZ domain [Filimonas lacunae]|uniref:Tricorn protease homolog n=1 Tax=Filimonas lacunae TaxID=477680 RepID=A0A173M9X9_9BACT|nr:S41 family peptidase [Filimonas lacunae]BAV04345.1 tolB protein precursor, periplasmic protein [Filimonas lacunae]SIT31085.1 C-terminal processing protease CtpA/Prc, contains a PDZ domain [Filimonas lacunae]